MHADFAVITGARHTSRAQPCQDYSYCEQPAPDRVVAVVADGCSGSERSDLGARAWALAALKVAREADSIVEAPQMQERVLRVAEPALAQLALEDGFATLGVLQAHGRRVHASFWGDGALLLRHTDGTLTLVNIQYPGNAPAYLNYLRCPHAQAAWSGKLGAAERLAVINRYDADGVLLSLRTEAAAVTSGPWTWQGHADDSELEMALLCTDGVASRAAGFVDTARALTDVKSVPGTFVRRRLAALARSWHSKSEMPADDLAVAGVWLGG